jgi:hypothetical protein
MLTTAHAYSEGQPAPARDEVDALRDLAADLAESAPVYEIDGQLVCALCDELGTAASLKHDPSCLIARAQRLSAKPRDAFATVDALGE